MTGLRVIFLGELSSTFSRLHYAVLAKQCEVVLWVAGKQNSSPTVARARFRSRRELLTRMMQRAELEWRAGTVLGAIPSRIQVRCPIETMPRNANGFTARFNELAPDLIVSAGFSRIVPEDALATARLGAYNCHPSPLPRYAGSNPWFWMLKHGEREGGVTIHRMVAEADAGEIAAQETFPIPLNVNHQWLYNMSSVQSAKLLCHVIANGLNELQTMPQNLLERTFFPAPRHQDYQIHWDESWETIRNLMRAASPAPGVWAQVNGQVLYFAAVRVVGGEVVPPGTIIRSDENGLIIACRDRLLRVNLVNHYESGH